MSTEATKRSYDTEESATVPVFESQPLFYWLEKKKLGLSDIQDVTTGRQKKDREDTEYLTSIL